MLAGVASPDATGEFRRQAKGFDSASPLPEYSANRQP
jgi:hypothetical protein